MAAAHWNWQEVSAVNSASTGGRAPTVTTFAATCRQLAELQPGGATESTTL